MFKKPKCRSETTKRVYKSAFSGINRSSARETGALSELLGGMPSRDGTLRPLPSWQSVYEYPAALYPQSISCCEKNIVTFGRVLEMSGDKLEQTDKINFIIRTPSGQTRTGGELTYRSDGDESRIPSDYNFPRSIVQYHVYSSGGSLYDAVGGRYDRRILVFPDRVYFDADAQDGFEIKKLDKATPALNYAAVHAARLFGCDDTRIYASAYNDPADWDVDTAEDIGASNAWVCPTGSDSRAGGALTAICSCSGGIVAFKEDSGYIISGTRNPFSMRSSSSMGALDFRCAVRVGDNICFACREGVGIFNGTSVKRIDAPLALDGISSAVCAGCGDFFYMLTGGTIYVYDTVRGIWGSLTPPDYGQTVDMAGAPDGLYCLCSKNKSDSRLFRLAGAAGDWHMQTSPLSVDGLDEKRNCTVRLECELSDGAGVSAFLCGQGEEKIPLFSRTGGGRQVLSATVRGGARYARSLRCECTGDAVLRAFEIKTREV